MFTKTKSIHFHLIVTLVTFFLGSSKILAKQLKAYEIPPQNISKEKYIESVNNYLAELKLARAVPFTDEKSEEIIGFKILEIQKESSLNIIGLQNGDVVKHVNFVEVNSLNKSLLLFLDLKSKVLETETMIVGIYRKNMDMNLNFRLVTDAKK